MSLDYHTYFSPQRLTRVELFDRINMILKMSGMHFSGECMRLSWSQQENQYVFNYEELQFKDSKEAILATNKWEGVMLEYSAPFGDRTVFFWKDKQCGDEVFGFDDPSGHFIRLTESESSWSDFEELLLDIAEALNSSFALVMAGYKYVTLTEKDISEILENILDEPIKAKPSLIILQSHFKLNSRALHIIKKYYFMRIANNFSIYREKDYGFGSWPD